jgi:hypothetical protein
MTVNRRERLSMNLRRAAGRISEIEKLLRRIDVQLVRDVKM